MDKAIQGFAHLAVEGERRGASEEATLFLEQGVVTAHLGVLFQHLGIVKGAVHDDATAGQGPIGLHRFLTDVLHEEQGSFLILGGMRDTKGATIVITDVALVGFCGCHHPFGDRRQGDAHLTHNFALRFVGGDPADIFRIDPTLGGAASGKGGADFAPCAVQGFRRGKLHQIIPEGKAILGRLAVQGATGSFAGLEGFQVDAPVIDATGGEDRLDQLVGAGRVTGATLHCSAPQFQVVVRTVLGEEFGNVPVLFKGSGRGQIVAVCFLEGCLDGGITKEISAVEVDLDEGFHRDAKDIAVGILEVIDEGVELALIKIRRLDGGVVGQALADVDQVILGQVGIDDILLDVDKVIDAGVGFHVLDRLVIHLIPRRGLKLNDDAGLFGKLLGQHILHKVGRRGVFRDATDGNAFVGRRRLRPPTTACRGVAAAGRLIATRGSRSSSHTCADQQAEDSEDRRNPQRFATMQHGLILL